MKLQQLLLATAAMIGGALSCTAQTNLISNGTFETWSSGVPTNWNTNISSNLYQNTGLGSGTSAVAQGTADLRQLTSAAAKDFNLSFDFTVNQGAPSAFSQSFIINLYQTTDLVSSGTAWISLRIQTNNASNQPFSLSANTGSGWQSLTGAIFTASVLNSGNTTFSSVSKYQLNIAFDDASNTYSIGYGAAGGSLTTLSSLAYFRNATTHDGLKGLQLYSNDGGFAVDNVVATAIPEPSTYALAASACAMIAVMGRRRRQV
ncbi:hypothetical protein [Rariglobus hedericola]|uniref:PEP-CTERM sorting domain-containing protein n=1 Tax=Rariglobus hedericola TaxID=2597822 RepID=A0A556QPG8_9BACT|nr:hypothetical protein [Rariglobus hedericola]TSJ78543.1 hypothetical protein FPL22_04385 [Rariglobus hedericola]